MAIYNASGVTW